MRRSGADCAYGLFFGGETREAAAPGAASAGRAGVRGQFCWAIRRPSTRTMRTRIAAQSPSMQLPCRRLRRPRRVFRQWPVASCSAPSASRPRCLSTAHAKDASPAAATSSVAATASASIKDRNPSRRAPRVVRWSREAAALPRSMPVPPVLTSRLSGASDSPPPRRFKRVAQSVPLCRCISPATPGCASIPDNGTSASAPCRVAAPTPDFRRPSGLPVCRRFRRPQPRKAAT